MTQLVLSWGEKPYRAQQLWSWLYVRLANSFEAMSDLPKGFRQRLQETLPPWLPTIREYHRSADGTEKWLLQLEDGQVVETVHIPDEERGTLCISTQAGCALACSFCHTGRQGFARNLTCHEIVGQVVLARSAVEAAGRKVTNVVMMGMGEPLYNCEAVFAAGRILMDANGLAFGSRKLTLSTAGVIPRLPEVARELGCNLAISLHSVRDEVRNVLVPLNRKYGIAGLRKAALAYPLKANRRIFWEYVLLKGVNDSARDARELIGFLHGIPSKVNLIPFNPWPGSDYQQPEMETALHFQEILRQAGQVAILRDSRGGDIAAACGQLRGALLGAKQRRDFNLQEGFQDIVQETVQVE
ncbi:MAG: 23S rRNA (adenine(2503)-C(2))-methyltransferase RlmN [Magnetococcales bacterium]|nr:23S rRNA (adenine(2503)-C(2))-methyltransferase RlmN [Magnetococcales bacterium]NGZ28584.1 23S rRNA (adenine(2503)-C(2))-methyltransferase RlmN [Magnetococcales bacterium]